jgi:hypothetical protein
MPKNLQSGDIILFRSNVINYKYFIFSHSFFTHIGIVIKNNNLITKNNNLIAENNNLYICEKNIPNTTIFGDSNINPLLDRIATFNGSCYLMKLNKPLNFIREQLLKSFALKTFVNPIYPNILNSIKGYFKLNYKYMHCFQYIAYILDHINITNNLYLHNNIEICNKVNNLFKKKLNDGYLYAKPVQIILDSSLHL